MGKDKKQKKEEPAPEVKENETGTEDTETGEKEQMTQDENTETAEQAAEETAEAGEEQEVQEAAAEPDAEKESGAEEPEEDAKGFFKKKKEKQNKEEDKIADLTDKLQRQMAEFENFRRRTEKEKSSMYDMGTRDTIEKLLPVIDNFERGLAGASEEDPFAEGMKMVYKQMMTILTDIGVTPIEAEGKEFDPNLHNAVMHVDDENFGDNVVAEELQRGYMFKDHVVRHSMVKVAN